MATDYIGYISILQCGEQKLKPPSLHLQNRPWRLKSKKAQPTAAPAISPPFGIWVLLRKTLEKAAHAGDLSENSCLLVQFYNCARTHFKQNC